MMLWLPLLIVALCRYVSATYDCAACDCCNNGASGCVLHPTTYEENYCFNGCIEGYYSSRCLYKCFGSCKTCTSQKYCTQCKDGYHTRNVNEYLQYCSSCSEHCTTCTSLAYCTRCNDGYYLINRIAYQNCVSCGADCTTCTSPTYCTRCNDGYYLVNNIKSQNCVSCRRGCTTCTSRDYCTRCNNGYYMNEQTQYCESCGADCKTCTSPNVCTRCNYGYNLYNDGQTLYCVSCVGDCTSAPCNDGYYLNLQGPYCSSCPGSCSTCTSFVDCTACNVNKYGSTCQYDCGRGCTDHTCDIDTGACKCASSSNFQGSGCDTCVDGKYGTTCEQELTDGVDAGVVIGASVGVVLLVLIIAGVTVAVILPRRRKARSSEQSGDQGKMDTMVVKQSDLESNGLPIGQIDTGTEKNLPEINLAD